MSYRISYAAPRRKYGFVFWLLWGLFVFREVLDPAVWAGLSWEGGLYECLARVCGRLMDG